MRAHTTHLLNHPVDPSEDFGRTENLLFAAQAASCDAATSRCAVEWKRCASGSCASCSTSASTR